jgi:DNA-binding SARP family transcriptional activator
MSHDGLSVILHPVDLAGDGAATTPRGLRTKSIGPNGAGFRCVSDADTSVLSLLGGFDLRRGGASEHLSSGAQRLLAFLGLHGRGRPVRRALAAGTMWPDVSEARAHANLRSLLHRLDGMARLAVEADADSLGLAREVEVDLWDAEALAHRLLDRSAEPSEADLCLSSVDALAADLLPDWYEDWVLSAAETWRQLRLHALEALARHLTARGNGAAAMVAALAAMRADQLRESAHAAVIRVHLAEGNQSEAIRAYSRYRALLFSELGLEPSAILQELVPGTQGPPRRQLALQASFG